MACSYAPDDLSPLRSFLGYVDCQAQTIGEQGYLALAAPGSIASLVLTGLLTILIALFGYRMLFGRVPELGDGILALVKIGIVVALATGWAGYRIVFYDVALRGPVELAAAIGTPAGLPGASGGLVDHLELVDQQFQTLAIAGVGGRFADFQAPPLFAGFDTFALGGARVAFLIGAMGAFAVTRLLAGLLLALGPLFIAFLLFDGTRGLFEGWLRVLAGAALGALATTIALSIELALLEPWLADLIARRAAELSIPGAPAQLLAASIVFDLLLLTMIAATARVAWGLRITSRRTPVSLQQGGTLSPNEPTMVNPASLRALPINSRSRAVELADSLATTERREIAYLASRGDAVGNVGTVAPPIGQGRTGLDPAARPVGRRERRIGSRVSASAGRRDAAR